jgi:cysteine-rich repeat protein
MNGRPPGGSDCDDVSDGIAPDKAPLPVGFASVLLMWCPRWVILALPLLLVLPASEAAGAIAFVTNVGTNGNTTTGSTIAVTVAAGGVAVNNTVIVAFAMDPATGAVTVADTRGNTYTSNADVSNGSGTNGVRTVVLSTRLTTALLAGDTITVTHPSVAARAVSVNVFSGLAGASVLDRTATGTGTSTAPATPATAATTQADELLIGAMGVETGSTETFTLGASYITGTNRSSSAGTAAANITIDPEYRIVAATGTYTATGTLSASRAWAAAIATYRAAICGNGVIEPGEQCDDGAANGTATDCCSATCGFTASGTVCRAAAGTCDVAETCTGSSAACPANQFASGILCRASAGVCDVAETCSGTSAACPADSFVTAGTGCRVAAGECDVAESCTGTSAACPADARAPAGTACTSDGNPCTADQCDGTNVLCQHPVGNAGAVCRASTGECDPPDLCTGTSATCPADARSAAGTACSSDGNPCTVDRCDGTSAACQHPAGNGGAVCRAAAGVCDLAESCTGTSAICPPDVKGSGICRPSAGDCDVAESCDGVGNDCPADHLLSAGTLCRAPVGACDRPEACTGTDAACPPDLLQPDGTPCDDGDRCTIGDVCQANVCVGTSPGLDCPDSFLCYKARSTGTFTSLSGVHLIDDFENGYFTVRKPQGLCMPADTNNTSIIGANRRLDGYAMNPQGSVNRQTSLKIVNALGTLVLNTGKPDVLRVPATLPSPPSTADPNGYVDHYKCYKTYVTPGTPKLQRGLQVSVSDQFTSPAKPFELKKPGHLCVPVDDSSQGVRDPTIYLLCYKASPAPGQQRGAPQLGIHLTDEFGPEVLNTVKEVEVCVPSVRIR